MNIKRTPLCGRNFEYVSEDPVVAGDLGAALVTGIQSQGVGTSLKHFAANNQESDRMRVSAQIDERTLREIYLPAFERVVTQAQPWTIMCAYNKINGTYAAENHWLLTEVLRDEWAFEGLVMSDWGAVHDRVPALTAGLDLQMPGAGPRPDEELVAAVQDGSLDEAVLDVAARRVLTLLARTLPALESDDTFDVDAHHALARQAAADGSVLLKNDGAVLPLASAEGVVVVGEFARTPRYQGAGSSQVTPTRLDAPLDALRGHRRRRTRSRPGSRSPADRPVTTTPCSTEAVSLARDAGTVVAFLGLPGPDESEGYDRPRLGLPDNQVAALRAIAAVNPRVVVVLANGSAVSVDRLARPRPGHPRDLAGRAGGWIGGRRPAARRAHPVRQARRDDPPPHRGHRPRSGTSPARPASSGTARASWSATAGTTPARWTSPTRSVTGSRTRRSPSTTSPRRRRRRHRRHRDRHDHQHRTRGRRRGGAGLRPRPAGLGAASDARAQGVRQGGARAG